MLQQHGGWSDWPPHKLSTAIQTNEAELLCAIETIGALERADVGFVRIGRKISIAALAIRPEF
jgi:hypothetical protein